jgi:hypothetical protein
MGISAILTAAMKHISWEQAANIAMQYAPDLVRKLKERMRSGAGTEEGTRVTAEHLSERVRELEGVLMKQGEMIEQLTRGMETLEENGRTLQARLNVFMMIAAVSVVMFTAFAIFILVK